jgi:translocation and assembly module TamA
MVMRWKVGSARLAWHITAMRRLVSVLVLAAFCGGGSARAADPVSYAVTFAPSGDAELDTLLKQTSSLVALQKKLPAAPFALIGRAEADRAQFLIVLHALGYDSGSVTITIAGQNPEDPALLDTLTQAPKQPAVTVLITPQKGPLYHLGTVSMTTLPAGFSPPANIKPGDPARATPILAVPPALTTALHNAGYAFATVSPPLAVADGRTDTLDVTYTVVAGPRVDIGAISFAGLTRTDPDFLRHHIALAPGQKFSDTSLSTARDSLLGLGVFSAVTPVPEEKKYADGEVPILFRVTEQKRHAVTLGASYATDTGFTLSTSWEDRNLFRHAETLTITAAASNLGGGAGNAPGYDLKAVFAKPDFYVRGQTFSLPVEGVKESLTAYNRTAFLAGPSLTIPLSRHITFGYGLGFVTENVQQEGVSRDYVLGQLPLSLTYDTADSVLEPTRGINANLTITPTKPLAGGAGLFTILQAGGSTYLPVERDARGILALRALVGSIQGASQFQVPPDQRFYAGGSGTVRGFTYQTIGPLFADDIPEGGTAIDAGTVEFRQRVGKNFGIVPFVDAGQVAASAAPFTGDVRIGAGIGARYYTGIGPIRLDIAVPLNRTAGSSSFALYIGLGEAF